MSKEYYDLSTIDSISTETVDKLCKYDFSDEEKSKISERMARAIGEKQEIDDEKKSVVKDYTSKLASKGVEIHSDARRINDGFELRGMPCWRVKDFDKDKIIYVRKDTGEIIDIAQMSDYDRQETLLPMTQEEDDKEKKTDDTEEITEEKKEEEEG
jgi:DNA mismatch repair ATPase MutL